MKTKLYFLFLMALSSMTFAQTYRYVKQNGTGNGLSWQTASNDLQLMINNSAPGDIIYVAEGTYKPAVLASDFIYVNLTTTVLGPTTPKDRAFVLKDGVKIYGGFSATNPTNDLSLRDFVANETIISGDINDNDLSSSVSTITDNVHHAIIAAGVGAGTELDGFTLRGGSLGSLDYILVNGTQVKQSGGGAISIVNSDVKIRNSKIINAYSAVFVQMGNPQFLNVSFLQNNSALDVRNSNIVIDNNLFSQNNGVLYFSTMDGMPGGSITIKNTVFTENVGGINAGRNLQENMSVNVDRSKFIANTGVYGPLRVIGGNLKVSNSIFSGNRFSNQSGAINIMVEGPNLITNADIVNTTIVSNKNGFDWITGSGGIVADNPNINLKIRNSIIWGNYKGPNISNISRYNNVATITVQNSIIQDAYNAGNVWNPVYGQDLGGNSGQMPTFENYVAMADQAFSTGNFRLAAGSNGIDQGSSAHYSTLIGPLNTALDLDGQIRVMGTEIDMGAYEFIQQLSTSEFDSSQNDVVFYPNPVAELLYIETKEKLHTYEVLSSEGRIVSTGYFKGSDYTIDMQKLSKGIYYVKVEGQEFVEVAKVIKK